MLPFTRDQFLTVFAEYNAAIWPAQILAYGLGAVAILALARRRAGMASGILAVLWLWTGIAYHWVFFAAINPAAFVFGAAFVVQGLLFLGGAGRRALTFGCVPGWRKGLGAVLIAYAMVVYPLAGWLAGHHYPAMPMFGVTPCPLTIFTFGVLAFASDPIPTRLLVVPVLWSLVGGSAAVLLGIPQDWMLPAAGLAAVLAVLKGRHGRA